MSHLDLSPGPEVGQALAFLLALKRTEGDLGTEELHGRLDAWWAEQN